MGHEGLTSPPPHLLQTKLRVIAQSLVKSSELNVSKHVEYSMKSRLMRRTVSMVTCLSPKSVLPSVTTRLAPLRTRTRLADLTIWSWLVEGGVGLRPRA